MALGRLVQTTEHLTHHRALWSSTVSCHKEKTTLNSPLSRNHHLGLSAFGERTDAQSGASGSWGRVAANGDLFDGKNSILAKYCRPETLESGLARGIFLMPDSILSYAALWKPSGMLCLFLAE
jgi:hypothetical protein